MVRFAIAVEEPLHGIITFFSAIALLIVLPMLTDIEGWMQGWMEATTAHALIYFAAMGGVIMISAIGGYYTGKITTWPLRYVIERANDRERTRNAVAARIALEKRP